MKHAHIHTGRYASCSGQGIIEYILAFAAVIVVMVAIAAPGGFFSTGLENAFDQAALGTECMTQQICYDPAGCPSVPANCAPIPLPPPPNPSGGSTGSGGSGGGGSGGNPPPPPPIDCGTAPTCPSASGAGTGTTQGSTVSFTCVSGFSGVGTTVTCDSTGNWSGSCPTCTPTAPSCGQPFVCPFASASGTGIMDGDTQTYTCVPGYTGASTVSTCSGGTWSVNCPACVIQGCGPAPVCPDTNASGTGTTSGDSRLYTCTADASITSTITCNALDTWAGTCPICNTTTLNCGAAPTCSLSNPSGTGIQPGDTRVYTCDPGYTGSPSTMVCSSSGTWAGTCPNCVGSTDCGPPPSCIDATGSGSGTTPGSTYTYACNSGFSGSSTSVTCNALGVWAGVCPTCTAGSCPQPPICPDATGSGTGLNEGDVHAYTCDAGFGGAPTTMTCSSGSWTGSCPTCASNSCGPVPTCGNATVSPGGNTVGDVRTITCDTNFAGAPSSITCDSSGFWLGPCPTCTATTCGSPPGCTNSTSGGGGTAPGDTHTYTCDAGFVGSSSNYTCNALGTWAGSCPTCLANDCPAAPTCSNASATGTGVADGDTRNYSCDPGYLGSGTTRTCSGGSWTGSCPSCTLDGCGLAPVCQDATATGTGMQPGDSRTYTCNAGYNGSPTTRSCTSSLTWDGFCPSCTVIPTCGSAPVCSGAQATGFGFNIGAVRDYTCDPQYLPDSSSIVCDPTGQWAGSCPNCVLPNACTAPPACPNTSMTGSGTNDGDTRNYTCDPGYLGNSSTLTCNSGSWGGSCPACSVSGCGPQPTCPNATVSSDPAGTTLSFTCLTNGNTRDITCDAGGFWSGPCPSC